MSRHQHSHPIDDITSALFNESRVTTEADDKKNNLNRNSLSIDVSTSRSTAVVPNGASGFENFQKTSSADFQPKCQHNTIATTSASPQPTAILSGSFSCLDHSHYFASTVNHKRFNQSIKLRKQASSFWHCFIIFAKGIRFHNENDVEALRPSFTSHRPRPNLLLHNHRPPRPHPPSLPPQTDR